MDINDLPDFTKLDDPVLMGLRAEMREQLERMPPNSADRAKLAHVYDISTVEVNDRARAAWSKAE